MKTNNEKIISLIHSKLRYLERLACLHNEKFGINVNNSTIHEINKCKVHLNLHRNK